MTEGTEENGINTEKQSNGVFLVLEETSVSPFLCVDTVPSVTSVPCTNSNHQQ